MKLNNLLVIIFLISNVKVESYVKSNYNIDSDEIEIQFINNKFNKKDPMI